MRQAVPALELFPITIRLGGVPKGKGRPRFVRATGHAFTPAATRSYEAALRLAAQDVMGDRAPLSGPLRVIVAASFAIPRSWSKRKRLDALVGTLRPTVKPDLDNLLKCLDALNGVVFDDDKQVVDATVLKTYADRPELTVQVTLP